MKRIFSLFLAGCLLLAVLPGHARAAGPTVAAKSAILMDMTTGTVLVEQNAHEPLAASSDSHFAFLHFFSMRMVLIPCLLSKVQ